MPIKVLQVIPSLNRGSGVTNLVMNIFRAIDRTQVQFDFLYFYEFQDSYKQEIEALGGRTFYLPILKPSNFILFSKWINSFIKKHKKEYSIIHLHEVLVGFILLPVAQYYGIKTRIVHSHNSEASENKMRAWRNNLLCLPLSWWATDFWSCSQKAALFLFGKRKMKDVVIVNNAIDTSLYKYSLNIRDEVRKELNIEQRFVIGHIGRFCIQKNHIFLLNILKSIVRKIPNVVLLLVGDGPLKEEIELEIQKMGLYDHVKFAGVRTDINRILQAMDVFVLPSLFEGLPVVGIEAQATGLPCVVSDAVTYELQITKDVFFLSLSEGINIWCDTICGIKENGYQHKDTSANIKEAGFDMKQQVNKLQNFYLSHSKY